MTQTQGYRAATVKDLYDGPPGGYTPVTNADTAGYVGRIGNHTVEEHDDGTITVSPSILSTTPSHGHDWHGFLERGVWREA